MTKEQVEREIERYEGQWEELTDREKFDFAELEFILSVLLNKEE